MALEPCWPLENGSNASPISVRCSARISVACCSSVAAMTASAGDELGVAVALQDLRRGLGRPQPEPIQGVLFDFGRQVGVRADGAREFADAQLVARLLQALAIAADLGDEHGQLVAERRRLGVDAVGAADRQRVLVAHRQLGQDSPRACAGPRPGCRTRPGSAATGRCPGRRTTSGPGGSSVRAGRAARRSRA